MTFWLGVTIGGMLGFCTGVLLLWWLLLWREDHGHELRSATETDTARP